MLERPLNLLQCTDRNIYHFWWQLSKGHPGRACHEAGHHKSRSLVMIDFALPVHHGRHVGILANGQPPVVDIKALARVVEGLVSVKPRKKFCLVRSHVERYSRVWKRLHYTTLALSERGPEQAREQMIRFVGKATRHAKDGTLVIVSGTYDAHPSV